MRQGLLGNPHGLLLLHFSRCVKHMVLLRVVSLNNSAFIVGGLILLTQNLRLELRTLLGLASWTCSRILSLRLATLVSTIGSHVLGVVVRSNGFVCL